VGVNNLELDSESCNNIIGGCIFEFDFVANFKIIILGRGIERVDWIIVGGIIINMILLNKKLLYRVDIISSIIVN
jgi:hypothetical protein